MPVETTGSFSSRGDRILHHDPSTELFFASWNIGGTSEDDALKAIAHSEPSLVHIAALQEMPRRPVGWNTAASDDFTVVQYRHDDQQWRGNAVCYRTSLFQVVRRKGCRFGLWLRLKHVATQDEFWVGSGRLSTGVTSDVTADEAQVLCRLLPPTLLPVLLLADFNTKLKWSAACGPTGVFRSSEARSDYLHSELANYSLAFRAPVPGQWEVPTSRPRRARARGHQIDGVVFKNTRLSPLHVRVDSYKEIGGDHERICLSLRLKTPVVDVPKVASARPRTLCGQLPSLDSVDQSVLQLLAKKHTKPKPGERYQDPPRIKELYCRAKRSRSEIAWKEAHKARRKAQEDWRRTKLEKAASCNWTEYRSAKQQGGAEWSVSFAEAAGELGKNPKRWTTEHFKQLFRQTAPRQVPRWNKEIDSGEHFTMDELKHAVAHGKKNKAVGEDLISFELLQGLIEDEPTARALLRWMENLRCGADLPQVWLRTIVTLLPKTDNVRSPAELRPISLGSAASKVFGTMLLSRTRKHIQPIGAAQCAHSGRQTADYLHAALRSFSLDSEWKLGLNWCRIDIRKAFDTVGRDRTLQLLRDRLPACMYSEYRCWERLFHEGTAILRTPWGDTTIPQTRGIRQGSVESPFLFAIAIEQALSTVMADPQWPRAPVSAPDLPVSELLYMDDLLLWSGSKSDMQKKYAMLKAELQKWGLHVNAEKTKYYRSPHSLEAGPILLESQTIENGAAMPVFGVPLSVPVKPGSLMDTGIAKATSKFYSNKHVFLARAPLKDKLKLFSAVVTGSALWYSCAMPPSVQAMGALNTAQLELVSKLAGFRRRTEESWLEFRLRSIRGARQLLVNHQVERWSTGWLKRYWDYKGHIARALYRTSPTASALMDNFRNCEWWAAQCRDPHGLKHPGSFFPHLSNEEKQLNKVTGSLNWRTQAQDPQAWNNLRTAWISHMDVAWTSGRQFALSQ